MQNYQIHLTRHDPTCNIERYYQLSLERTLFGGLVFTRRWGRIGCLGKFRQVAVTNEIDGLEMLLRMLRAKRRRGYVGRMASRASAEFARGLSGGCLERAHKLAGPAKASD